MGHCSLKRVMDKTKFPKRGGRKLCPRRKSRGLVRRKDEHHQLQRPMLPPAASVLIPLPACRTHPGRPVDIAPLNSLKTTLKGGHFYPRNADKKTEVRVFLPKTMELIMSRTRIQTKAKEFHSLHSLPRNLQLPPALAVQEKSLGGIYTAPPSELTPQSTAGRGGKARLLGESKFTLVILQLGKHQNHLEPVQTQSVGPIPTVSL